MRQEEGATAIEASKIAGHATLSQTGDYTAGLFVLGGAAGVAALLTLPLQ